MPNTLTTTKEESFLQTKMTFNLNSQGIVSI